MSKEWNFHHAKFMCFTASSIALRCICNAVIFSHSKIIFWYYIQFEGHFSLKTVNWNWISENWKMSWKQLPRQEKRELFKETGAFRWFERRKHDKASKAVIVSPKPTPFRVKTSFKLQMDFRIVDVVSERLISWANSATSVNELTHTHTHLHKRSTTKPKYVSDIWQNRR